MSSPGDNDLGGTYSAQTQDVTDAGGFSGSPVLYLAPGSHQTGPGLDDELHQDIQFAYEDISTPPMSPPQESDRREPAGPVLLNKQPPRHLSLTTKGVSGGEALFGSFAQDKEITLEEVFDESDGDEIVFKPENANSAVQHYIFKTIAEKEVAAKPRNSKSDVTDAGGDANPDWTDQTLPGFNRQISGAAPIQPSFLAVEQEFKYDMNHMERGCFVIFNQMNFDPHLKLLKRNGTDKDALNLQNTAKHLGFEYIRVFNDCTKEEMLWWIKTLSTADHSNYDCLVVCILTHGGDKDVLYAKDEQFELKELTRPFRPDKCESLAAKPKMFFIQACRGFQLDKGAQLPSVQSDAVDGIRLASNDCVDGVLDQIKTIPVEADFLIGQSTVPEYYSWRNEMNGSIFVQNLCACMHKWGDTMELMQILTRVNRMTAYEFHSASDTDKMNKKKQIPSITTRLTAEVYFPRKIREERIETDHCPVEVEDPRGRIDVNYNIQSIPQIKSNSDAPPIDQELSAGTSRVMAPPDNFYPPPVPPKKNTKKEEKADTLCVPGTSASSKPLPINTLRKVSVPTNIYSRSADRHMHHSETTPTFGRPRSNSAQRRSFPVDASRVVVTDQRLQVGNMQRRREYIETDI